MGRAFLGERETMKAGTTMAALKLKTTTKETTNRERKQAKP